MGQARARRTATEKLIAQYPQCALCGGVRPSATREHMPPRSLFDQSHRPDKLVMPACKVCNGGTSTADLTASMVSRWNYNSPYQEQQDHSRLANQVRIQAPELIAEWTKIADLDRQDAMDHLRNYGVMVPDDAGLVSVGPNTIRQLNVFAHKAVLCLYFEHFKKILSNQGLISAHWRTKEDFFAGAPTEILNIFPKYGALLQGKWNTAETFEYRYDLNDLDGLFGCLARFRTGLYVVGFAISDADKKLAELGEDWIRPIDLLSDPAHFSKKN